MRKLCFILIFLIYFGFPVFGDDDQEEIDYLLFLPNSSNMFVNEEQAMIQLDNAAKYLTGRNLISGQIYVYGYAAESINDIEPLNLSKDRALFVKNELQKRGVPMELFSEPIGYGSVDLWGSNTTEEDKTPNRRVRILVDGSFITPVTLKAADSEIEVSSIYSSVDSDKPVILEASDSGAEILITDSDKKEIKHENIANTKNSTFPWLLFFILIILAVILAVIFLLSKNKKSSKPHKENVIKIISASAAVPSTTAHSAAPIPTAKPFSVAASAATAPVAAAPVTAKHTVVNLDDEIRRRAYELYLERNGQNENADEDWYIAVRQIAGQYEADNYHVYTEDRCWWARK